MRKHPVYQKYPAEGVPNLGVRRGYFENIVPYVAMAFDKKDEKSVVPLCSNGNADSLFVWSDRTMSSLKHYADKKGGGAKGMRKVQLDAIAYLWEMCYDLLLASADSVSASPGFEALGLRVNAQWKKDQLSNAH